MELVGVGGVAGALARHLVSERVETATYDTLAVNALGSLLLGVIAAASLPEGTVLALGAGFCGAFTTFSSFAFETVRLAEDGFGRLAVRNAVANLLAALVAVGVGLWIGGAV